MLLRASAVVVAALVLVSAAPAAGLRGPARSLAAGVLASRDLAGAKVGEQGAVEDVAALAAYEREFGPVTYRRSRLVYVENRLMLYRSAFDAGVARAAIAAVVDTKGKGFETLLAAAVAHYAGLPLTSWAVRRDEQLALPGAEGRMLLLRVVTPLGRVDEGYVFLQAGKLVGTLTVMSSPGSALEHADLVRLYRTVATRMRTQLDLLQ